MRWLGTFFVTGGDQGFTARERAFFAFSWIPKATVQAAIGGIVLDTARSLGGISDENRALYQEYGNIVLSMAVMSIILTAPTGAILINTLGEKWLTDDRIWEIQMKEGIICEHFPGDENGGEGEGDKKENGGGDANGVVETERNLKAANREENTTRLE